MLILLLIIIVLIGLIYYFWLIWKSASQRKAIKQRSTPAQWKEHLNELSWFKELKMSEQTKLIDHIKVFMHEKNIQDIKGQDLSEKESVQVSAFACLGLIHRPTNYFALIDRIDVDTDKKNSFGVSRVYETTGKEIDWFEILYHQFREEINEEVDFKSLSFSLACEKFFLSPEKLKSKNQKVYSALKDFFY